MKRSEICWLVVLFLVVFGLRLWFAFQLPFLSSDESYFHVRQVEHIRATGVPLFDDALSYGGRVHVFSPVFHYVLAFFMLFLPEGFVLKFLPNVFASLVLVFVFLIARRLTQNSTSAFVSSFAAGFIPLFFGESFNHVSPLSFVLVLFLALVWLFLRVREPSARHWFIGVLVVFAFSHPLVLLFALGLGLYLLFVVVEDMKLEAREFEIALFSLFFVLWSQLILFKKVLFVHGPAVFWQNIPQVILNNFFQNVSLLNAIYQIGLVPFVVGMYVMWRYLFQEKRKELYFVMSFAAAAGLLLWLKLIPLATGLVFLSVVFVLLLSQQVKLFLNVLRKSRVERLSGVLVAALLLFVVATSVLPSVWSAQSTLSRTIRPETVAGLVWIQRNTPVDAVVLAPAELGNIVAAFARRKTVIDADFLLRARAAERYEDVGRIYTTVFAVEAIGLLNKYDGEFILVSQEVQQQFGISDLAYVKGNGCFRTVYSQHGVVIYSLMPGCRVRMR